MCEWYPAACAAVQQGSLTGVPAMVTGGDDWALSVALKTARQLCVKSE